VTLLLPLDHVTVCPVDAGGVAAEWVEATVATPGQTTFVCFAGADSGDGALAANRWWAEELAASTGARVLSVGCRSESSRPYLAVEDALTAWTWLLGEGVALSNATFFDGAGVEDLAGAVRSAARDLGLPVPAAGAPPDELI
jgi:hypothetical protein